MLTSLFIIFCGLALLLGGGAILIPGTIGLAERFNIPARIIAFVIIVQFHVLQILPLLIIIIIIIAGEFLFSPSEEASAKCVACFEGLYCPGGNSPPMQAARYAAGPQIYTNGPPAFLAKCASKERCPFNTTLGTCPKHRDSDYRA
ncbi:MAG: hypothetical protein VXW06_02395, partial [Pseudomonadota bacterium]|nr:hypothetical protein [Pseudomonadota bacterium]